MADPSIPERKLAAKRANERVKLTASSLNTVGLAVIGAALIVPTFNETVHLNRIAQGAGLGIGTGLHLLAQWVFRFLRSED